MLHGKSIREELSRMERDGSNYWKESPKRLLRENKKEKALRNFEGPGTVKP